MSAKMASMYREMMFIQTTPGCIIKETFAVTGCVANSANTVPFPEQLLTVPRRVYLTSGGDAAAGAFVSIDTSQGAADPTNSFSGGKLGVDQNNLYINIGNATEFELTVEYSQG